jgi:spore coat-associated protein N
MGKRMKVLGKRRTTVIVTLAVLLLATAVVIGSGANFTSQQTNLNNSFTAGTLTLVENSGNSFTITKMIPGETKFGDFNLGNTGDVDGTLSLTVSNLAGTGLAPALTLRVYKGASLLYTTAPFANGTYDLGTLGAGTNATYRVELAFPNGTPAHDNPFQGKTALFDLTWDLATAP